MQRREFITSLGAAAAVWKRTKRPTTLLREAGYLLLGLVSLATVTGLYFWLDVPLVSAAFTYLRSSANRVGKMGWILAS